MYVCAPIRTPAWTDFACAASRASGIATSDPATVIPHSRRVKSIGGMVLQIQGLGVRGWGLLHVMVARHRCSGLEAGTGDWRLDKLPHLSYSPIVRRWEMRASHR